MGTLRLWPSLSGEHRPRGLGLLVGLVTTRLGVLSLAIMTLAIAGFFDEFAVNMTWLVPGAGGSVYARPKLPGLNFESDRAFAYLMMVVFVILAFVVARVLRGPTGLALRAVRSDEVLSQGSRPIAQSGTSPGVRLEFVHRRRRGSVARHVPAPLGQGDVATLVGVVWLAVIVTIGWRHPAQALVAGLVFYLMPAVFTRYLPASWSQVPTILFGLGAVALVQAPDGVISLYAGYPRTARAKFAAPTGWRFYH